MPTAIIKVFYYGLDEPEAVIPDKLKDQVEVQFVNSGERDQFVLEHNGVTVYSCLDDATATQGNANLSEYHMATGSYIESDSSESFDIRDLPKIPQDCLAPYEALFPESRNKQLLAYSIDMGFLTVDGFTPPVKEK